MDRSTILAIGAALGTLGVVLLISKRASAASTGPRGPKRVALVGDSYAVGLGPKLQPLIPGLQFQGVVGTNTAQWSSHAAACGSCGDWLLSFKPDVVLVSLGVNDGATPNAANYHALVQKFHGLGATVIWIEPPLGVNAPGIDAVRNVIRSLGVKTVPARNTPLAPDNLHPANYSPWAAEIAAVVGRE